MKIWSGFMTTAGWGAHQDLLARPDEARWLLDVARGIGTTHVAVITELAGTSWAVLDWLDAEIRGRGMQTILWTSKGFTLPWRRAEGLAYARELARRYPAAMFDIAREADFLWQVHPHPEAEIVDALWHLKMELIAYGVLGERIMAGGHTRSGAVSIDRIGPGWVTVTGYSWVDMAFAQHGGVWLARLAEVVKGELLALRAATDPAHRICVAEIGWTSVADPALQANVLRETLRGIAESGVVDGWGYWTIPDFVHCVDTVGDSSGQGRCDPSAVSFGFIGADGAPKPAYAVLRAG